MKKNTTSDLLLADLLKLSNISTVTIIEQKSVEIDLLVKKTAIKVVFGLKDEYKFATELVNKISTNYLNFSNYEYFYFGYKQMLCNNFILH